MATISELNSEKIRYNNLSSLLNNLAIKLNEAYEYLGSGSTSLSSCYIVNDLPYDGNTLMQVRNDINTKKNDILDKYIPAINNAVSSINNEISRIEEEERRAREEAARKAEEERKAKEEAAKNIAVGVENSVPKAVNNSQTTKPVVKPASSNKPNASRVVNNLRYISVD